MAVETTRARRRGLLRGPLRALGEGNWRATEIDFSQDRDRLARADDRRAAPGALILFALFFHGEDAVTDKLSPYIDAAPLEEQKYFLATQQVDEARHAVFFKRFMDEVVGLGDGTIGGALRATDAADHLGPPQGVRAPRGGGRPAARGPLAVNLAAAVTMYHVVVEGMLAQPSQHTIERGLTELDLLPGFREGMRNVSLDEQRHIAFGVRLLADLYAEDPEPVAGRDRREDPRGRCRGRRRRSASRPTAT